MDLRLIGEIILFLFLCFMIVLLKPRRYKRKNRQQIALSLNEKNHLALISEAIFTKKPLMNKSEYQLFLKITQRLSSIENRQYFRLFSQVSMGEILATKDNRHFALINSKRIDFLIIDRKGYPVIAIEYQGKGHYQQNAIERDAIKREACRKANIKYLEFDDENDQIQLEAMTKYLHLYLEEHNAKPNSNQLAESG
ncbi:hypothetical protein BKG96_02660 [Rodentibacter caecimuris]|uniref:DUF2726 domain-containing protein n=1 Tax=Rodentibacter caecimuris TaxID=1796644 RepID=A0A1V3KNJ3_9PAST|nr:DUF2726 domain-containing protein [Rodentibacter heylii]OOF79224.1 hypothetical protein BKG96_02660 [Rodentibacter heylii]